MSKEEDSSAADSSFNDSILKDDFDLSTLKIAQLKTVLTSNEIGFKAHDKKASLVKLVEDNLDSIRNKLEKDGGLSPLAIPSAKVTKKKRESKKRKSTTPETLEKSLTKTKSSKKSAMKEGNEAKDDERPVSKKRKKRTKDEDGQGSDTEDIKPVKKTRKTKKKVKSEEIGSPIAKKVTTKSPIKSPHRSLIIDKFESSDDASDDTGKDDSFINFSIKKTAKPKKSELPETNSILSDIPNEPSLKTRAEFPSVTDSSLDPSTSESTPIKKKAYDSTPAKTLKKVEQEAVKKEELEVPATELPTSKEVTELQKQVNQSINTETEEESDTTITKEEPFVKDEENEEEIPKSATEKQSEDLLEDENEVDEGENTILKDANSIIEAVENKTDEIPTKETSISSILKNGLISTGRFVLKVISFLLILLPILFALWYRQQRIAVGFCASEVDIPTLGREYSNPYINEFENQLDRFKPQCIPCPSDAICYPYLEIKCKPGYIVEESPLSLHGLIPVHAKCVKDSRKQKLVQEVVKKTLELLRTKNAQESCGEDEDDYKSGISNAELYEIFYESKKPWINDEEFNALWQQVEVDLKEEPEIIWRQLPTRSGNNTISGDSNDIDTSNGDLEIERPEGHFQETELQQGYFRSTSKKYIGLKCQFERQVHTTWKKYQRIILTVVSLLIMVQLLKSYISKKIQERERIEKISQQVMKRLQQAIILQKQPRYMSSVQLRDLILNDLNDLNEKNRLWALTTKKLDSNTNVKSTLMEIHGEIMKCWEWIGVLPFENKSDEGSTKKNKNNENDEKSHDKDNK